MIQQHFTDPAHWERWVVLSQKWPEDQEEVASRALLLYERCREAPQLGDPIIRACERADAAMEAARNAEPAAPIVPMSRIPWRGIAAALAASLIASLGLQLLPSGEPEAPTIRWRGGGPVPAGTVWATAEDGRRYELDPGSGFRPAIPAGRLELVGDRNATVWVWNVESTEVKQLAPASDLVVNPKPGDTWVLGVLPDDADPDVVRDLVGDGRQPVQGLGGLRLMFVDFES